MKEYRYQLKKSKLESLSLSSMYKFVTNGGSLVVLGAHNSLAGAPAQSDLLLHPSFVPYLGRTDFSVPSITFLVRTN